jgi:hypothetical protein
MLKQVIHIVTIFYILLYGCKTWLLTLREKHRLGVFRNGVLRKRPKRVWGGVGWGELQETGKNCMMRCFIICMHYQYHWMITSPRTRWAGYVAHLGGEEVRTKFW